MGVPHLFGYLAARHGRAVLSRPSEPLDCDALLVDLNCAVHRCAEGVAEGGAHEAVADAVVAWLERLVAAARPAVELAIALDGPPPRAKMVQQRGRRFLSALEGDVAEGRWDPCCATPGTAFMRLLDARLLEALPRLERAFAPARVHLSGSAEPGEGEHKLFARLAARADLARVCVYGADADLILLALRCAAPRPFVLREARGVDAPGSQELELLDVAALRSELRARHGVSPEEFVAVCALLGNDFVPSLSFLRARDQGVDALMDMYSKTRAAFGGRHFLTRAAGASKHLTYDFPMLCALIERVARAETAGMARLVARDARQSNTHTSTLPPADEVRDALRAMDVDAGGAWRAEYSALLLPGARVPQACDAYLAGLAWTLAYYSDYAGSGARLSDWHYPHAYSPTAADVACRARALGPEGFEALARAALARGPVTRAVAQNAALQLLLVLPPSRAHLLPAHLAPAMLDARVEHFYPRRFRVATAFRSYASECSPLLPDIDGALVARVAARLGRRLT